MSSSLVKGDDFEGVAYLVERNVRAIFLKQPLHTRISGGAGNQELDTCGDYRVQMLHYSDTEVLLLPSLIYQIHKSDCDVKLCEGQRPKQPESWDDM